jgi:hypothetical protein
MRGELIIGSSLPDAELPSGVRAAGMGLNLFYRPSADHSEIWLYNLMFEGVYEKGERSDGRHSMGLFARVAGPVA